MGTQYRPNQLLRAALAEAGWTGQQLAAAVNAVGAESGLGLRYDRTSVAHWLVGVAPRPPVPDLVAEAISRRLAYPITAGGLGFAPATGKHNPDQDEACLDRKLRSLSLQGAEVHVVAELAALAAGQASRRRALAGTVYSLAALAVPPWAQAARPRRSPATDARQQKMTPAAVDAAQAMADVFSSTDAALGGGSARRALAAYLAHDVVPRLRSPATPGVRRRLYSVAGQLTYLCAFMCFDDELHGFAQRYWQTSLALASEGGDVGAYAVTLRAMSVQARILGHHRQAVRLAETAATTGRSSDPLRQAFLYGQLAVAHAADGDRGNALATLTAAHRRLDRATSPTHPAVGAYHPASLAHQQAAVQALLGDRSGAITALTASIAHRPPAERRSRAITLARLAELQLGQGHLEEAAATWHQFLDDYPHLTSGRATTALKTLRSRIRPHSHNSAAKVLLARATLHTT